jgi:hypothetical protein
MSYFMVSLIGFPFVSFNNWISKNEQKFKRHIKNIVYDADDS